MNIYQTLLKKKQAELKCFALLIDPDEISSNSISAFIENCNNSEVDIILIGGSLVQDIEYEAKVSLIKSLTEIPVIIFPGSVNQISPSADAIFYLSLLSGRNPEYLIGNQVTAAPIIHKLKLEAISTAYLLIESGSTTSVEFMSNTKPIPREKSDIAVAHALAAQLLGFKLIYLEAGSGAKMTVPDGMISVVSKSVNIPIIVGGGIKSPSEATKKTMAGADIIVIGNHFQNSENNNLMKEFAHAIHNK